MSAHGNSFSCLPADALRRRPEEFLYLACLHEGTGVDEAGLPRRRRRRGRADRARDADAQRRRRAASLRLEPLQLGLPRTRPLAPDRARASAPRASTSLNVADDPRRPRIEKVIERDELVRDDRLDASAHRALHARRQHRHQHARRRRRQRRLRLRGARRRDVRGQGPLGERRRASGAQLRLLVSAAQERARLLRVRRAQRLRAGLRPRRRRRRALRQPDALLEPRASAALEQTLDLGETGLVPLEVRWLHDPDAERASSAPRCRARSGTSSAPTAAGRPSR